MKIARSVAMLPAALIYQKGKFGMHFPSKSVSQNFCTGVQVNITTSSCDKAHNMMIVPPIQMTRFIWWTASTR